MGMRLYVIGTRLRYGNEATRVAPATDATV